MRILNDSSAPDATPEEARLIIKKAQTMNATDTNSFPFFIHRMLKSVNAIFAII